MLFNYHLDGRRQGSLHLLGTGIPREGEHVSQTTEAHQLILYGISSDFGISNAHNFQPVNRSAVEMLQSIYVLVILDTLRMFSSESFPAPFLGVALFRTHQLPWRSFFQGLFRSSLQAWDLEAKKVGVLNRWDFDQKGHGSFDQGSLACSDLVVRGF